MDTSVMRDRPMRRKVIKNSGPGQHPRSFQIEDADPWLGLKFRRDGLGFRVGSLGCRV